VASGVRAIAGLQWITMSRQARFATWHFRKISRSLRRAWFRTTALPTFLLSVTPSRVRPD